MDKRKSEILYLTFIIFCEIYWFNGIAYAKMSYVKYITYPFIFVAVIIWIMHSIIAKYNKKQWAALVIGLLISVVYYVGTGLQFEGILTIVPAIIGIKNVEIKKVTKVMSYTLIISYILFICLNIIGLVPYTESIKIR